MFTTEGDHHDRLRRLVARAFTPRAVDELRGDAARAAAASLASVRSDGGGDVGAALGLLPMQVMCRLLVVPSEDVATFAAAKRAAGTMMDVKLLLLLGAGILARQ